MRPVLPSTCDELEQEFALWLEDASLDNQSIYQILIERYAGEVYNLAWDLLSYQQSDLASEEAMHTILQHTFRMAIAGLPGFHGQESVRSWLFNLTIHTARTARRRLIWQSWRRYWTHSKPARPYLHPPLPRDTLQEKLWANVQALEEKLRLVTLLRYAYRLSLPEIACVLKSHVYQVHSQLVEVRNNLFIELSPGDEEVLPHKEIHSQIHAFLDGCMDNEQVSKAQLATHLENCPACRFYLNRLSDLEVQLSQELPLRWLEPEPIFNASQEILTRQANSFEKNKTFEVSLNKGLFPGKELVWLSSVLMFTAVFAWYLIRNDPYQGMPLFPASPTPPPTPVFASKEIIHSAPRLDFTPGEAENYYIMNPSISADGHRVAYELFTSKLIDGSLTNTSQVKVYDQPTGQLYLISATSDGKPANGSSLMPILSTDGEWVAFASNSSNLVRGDQHTCQWGGEEINCFDIFIRNLRTGEIRRISTTFDGSDTDGHCVLPTLSPEGNWVAYWSFASNIIPESEPSCRMTGPGLKCWDIYLHNIQSQEIIRIPVGRTGQASEYPAKDLLSLSENGYLLALTIESGDNIAVKLQVHNNHEVFLYKRELKTFEAVNLNTDGKHGNGDTFNPNLTPDGRFVVFTSEARNLVNGDRNQHADVFVHDRVKGSTERVSIASDGQEGDHPSGLRPDNNETWGARNSISADGRFVTFFSTADNLGEEKNTTCHSGGWFPCSRIYIRDRQRGSTQALIQGQPLNAYFLYPSISSDGGWISFVHIDLECPRKPICSVLLLRDQQTKQFSQFINPIQIDTSDLAQPFENSIYFEIPSSRVNHLDFSQDGKLLAAGDDDGSVRVWNAIENNLVYHLEDHNLPISSIAFSPDNRLLATGSYDGKIIIYRATDGTQLYNLIGNGKSITSLAFSANGEILAVGASDIVWNLEAAKRTFSTLDYSEYTGLQISQVAFSPDGKLIAHALSDHTVWLRRVSNGEIIARLSGSESRILEVAFSPDGNYLASGSADGRVDLWRIKIENQDSWKIESILTLLHANWINDIDFSPDSEMLAVASLGSSVCLWRIPSGELVMTSLGTTWDQALSVAFSPDGKSLAVSLSWGGIKIWTDPQLH